MIIGFFLDSKGLVIFFVMIVLSVVNYVVLLVVVYLIKVIGVDVLWMIILMNIVIMLIGVGLVLIVKYGGWLICMLVVFGVES